MATPDILTVAADPKFQALQESDQHAILGHLDPNFASLPDEDKPHIIDTLQRHALTRPDLVTPPGIPRPQVNVRMSPLGKGYEGPGAHDIPGSFEGHPENIGEWPVAGPGEIAGGVKDIAHGNIARGGHRILSGAGNTIMPMTPFIATPAPLAAARAVAGGYIGGRAAEAGADALNLNPDQKQLAGDVGNVIGGGVAAEPGPFIRGTGRLLTAKPRAAIRGLGERMRNFGNEPPAKPEIANPFRDVPDPEADVFREPPTFNRFLNDWRGKNEAMQAGAEVPSIRRVPGQIAPEMIRPRAFSPRIAEPLPARPGLALPAGPSTPPPVSAAGSLVQRVQGWTPPDEFQTPFQAPKVSGFQEAQDDAGVQQEIGGRIEGEGQRLRTNRGRQISASITPKSELVREAGGVVPEKPIILNPKRGPHPLKAKIASPAVESGLPAVRVPAVGEDLTPLLEESLRRARLKRQQ